jgi:nickel-type superoxide dismutase maturation protease
VLLGIARATAVLSRVMWPLSRVNVAGDSMLPTLEAGDRLLVLRVGHRRGLRPGDLVTLRDPREHAGRRVLVKRVGDMDSSTVAVTGDNPDASTDSRSFGRVPLDLVHGKVLYRYAPSGRAGIVN